MGAKNLKPFKITWLEALLVWNVPKFYTENEVLKVLNILDVLEDNQVTKLLTVTIHRIAHNSSEALTETTKNKYLFYS